MNGFISKLVDFYYLYCVVCRCLIQSLRPFHLQFFNVKLLKPFEWNWHLGLVWHAAIRLATEMPLCKFERFAERVNFFERNGRGLCICFHNISVKCDQNWVQKKKKQQTTFQWPNESATCSLARSIACAPSIPVHNRMPIYFIQKIADKICELCLE